MSYQFEKRKGTPSNFNTSLPFGHCCMLDSSLDNNLFALLSFYLGSVQLFNKNNIFLKHQLHINIQLKLYQMILSLKILTLLFHTPNPLTSSPVAISVISLLDVLSERVSRHICMNRYVGESIKPKQMAVQHAYHSFPSC